MKITDLHRFNQIVIQLHDNPDADAVGSGYALYRYFLSLGKDVRMVYGGKNPISKSNMKLMISELEIPLDYVQTLEPPELLLTVDCQHGEGNVQNFEAHNIAMIDHHSTGRISGDMAEIRTNLVSCSTICYAMLQEVNFDVNQDVKIATALYYGLYMDSSQLSEISHPLDRDMIDYLRYDRSLITRLKYANFSISELETAGVAISRNNYIEDYHAAIVKSDPCDPNILGVIGDFVIQVDSIDICVIFNECIGGYKLSVRSCSLEAAANEIAAYITAGVGNGGGHFNKAGGFISRASLANASDLPIEEYLSGKLNEYFKGYDVVRYTDELKNPEQFTRCRKKPRIIGYVKSTDIAPAGTEFKVRTLEGDVMISASDDINIMVGMQGEVYPTEVRVFEQRYTPLDEPYTGEFEYNPSIIDIAAGKPRSIMPYAKQCRSGAGAVVRAKKLTKFTKVFSAWDYEGYMAGLPGDMLCYTDSDNSDVYIVKKELFAELYEEVHE